MADEYFEGDHNEDVNDDDEELNEEHISEEGEQQIEEEAKEEERNRELNNSDEEEKIEEENDQNYEILDQQTGGNPQNTKKKAAERITPRFMTKYERARIIGTRALQISKNSIVYVDLGRGLKSFFILKNLK